MHCWATSVPRCRPSSRWPWVPPTSVRRSSREAKAEYEEATRPNPKLGPAHNNLAVIYLLTGLPAEAETELSRAEKSGFPVNPHLKEDIKKAKAGGKP